MRVGVRFCLVVWPLQWTSSSPRHVSRTGMASLTTVVGVSGMHVGGHSEHLLQVCPLPAVFVDHIRKEYEKIQQSRT